MLRVIDNLVVREILTGIRKRGIDPASFRKGISDIGRYMAYEFADTLRWREVDVETPLGLPQVLKSQTGRGWWC